MLQTLVQVLAGDQMLRLCNYGAIELKSDILLCAFNNAAVTQTQVLCVIQFCSNDGDWFCML